MNHSYNVGFVNLLTCSTVPEVVARGRGLLARGRGLLARGRGLLARTRTRFSAGAAMAKRREARDRKV